MKRPFLNTVPKAIIFKITSVSTQQLLVTVMIIQVLISIILAYWTSVCHTTTMAKPVKSKAALTA